MMMVSQEEIKDLWFKLLAEIIDNTVPDLVTSRNAHATSTRFLKITTSCKGIAYGLTR